MGYFKTKSPVACEEGRIDGAFKLSDVWIIPKNAENQKIDKRPKKQ